MNEIIYRTQLTPDATLKVEDSGNVVLETPERSITITHIQRWIDELMIARQVGQATAS